MESATWAHSSCGSRNGGMLGVMAWISVCGDGTGCSQREVHSWNACSSPPALLQRYFHLLVAFCLRLLIWFFLIPSNLPTLLRILYFNLVYYCFQVSVMFVILLFTALILRCLGCFQRISFELFQRNNLSYYWYSSEYWNCWFHKAQSSRRTINMHFWFSIS